MCFACSKVEGDAVVLVTLLLVEEGAAVEIRANSGDVLLGGQIVEYLKGALVV